MGREPQAVVSKEVLENTCKKQLEEVTLEDTVQFTEDPLRLVKEFRFYEPTELRKVLMC